MPSRIVETPHLATGPIMLKISNSIASVTVGSSSPTYREALGDGADVWGAKEGAVGTGAIGAAAGAKATASTSVASTAGEDISNWFFWRVICGGRYCFMNFSATALRCQLQPRIDKKKKKAHTGSNKTTAC